MEPDELIQLIPELRGRVLTGTPLGGGLTNRNYRLDGNGESFVLRMPGEDFLGYGRKHLERFLATLVRSETPGESDPR